MSNISIIGTSGIGHGETLPNEGRRHGEIFELIPDTLSKPKLYTWNSITKKWDILSGDGSSEGGTYTNVEPTISALGGIGVGNNFVNHRVSLKEYRNDASFAYLYDATEQGILRRGRFDELI